MGGCLALLEVERNQDDNDVSCDWNLFCVSGASFRVDLEM